MSTLDQSQAEQPSLKELTPEDSKALQNYLRRLASKSEALDGEASIVVKKINRTLEKYGHSLVTLGDHPEWLLGKGDTDEMEQRLAEYVAAYKQTLAKTKPLMNENAYLRAENQKLKDKLSFRKKITDEFSRKASTVTSGLRSIFKRNENSYEEKITYGDVRGLTEPLRNSGWFLGPWMVFPDYICNRLLLPDHEKESFEMMVWETIAQSITSAIIGGVTIGVLNGADKLATWQFQVKPACD